MCDDVENRCRTCLDVGSDHVSIFGDPTIGIYMKSCLSVTISSNDHLPQTICMPCVSQLSQFYHFQLNARCSQDWLESSLQQKQKKSNETKTPLQPLPDSEYNSDSLLEFLNNTANIEEYLNNLGKEDIPSIVNMLDKNEHAMEFGRTISFKTIKQISPKKKDNKPKNKIKMEIDILDSDKAILKEIIMKETDTKTKANNSKVDKSVFTCYGCHAKFDGIHKMSQHISTCDNASRTCLQCKMLFDSKKKMLQHSITHNTNTSPMFCNCGEQFPTKEALVNHHKTCHGDFSSIAGIEYRCKECGETFKERFQLFKHARDHILKAEKRICDICNHIFNGNEALAKHRKETHDKSEDVLYRCKVCYLTLPSHREMYLHIQKHLAKPEPIRHLCESCGRSFASRSTLLRHALQHETKVYKCNVCNRKFTSDKARDAHVMEHNEISMCDKCGNTISSISFEEHSCV